MGSIPHPIAVDNYFVDRELTPRDADGNYDFECLEAIDVEQFNRDMQDLLDGKEVYLPIFNFKTGKRMRSSVPKKLGEQDILVIEGIHCLNPKLTRQLNDENKFKIYISALTQLNVDEHNRIPTTDGRFDPAARAGCEDTRRVCDTDDRNVAVGQKRGGEKYLSISGRGGCDVQFVFDL